MDSSFIRFTVREMDGRLCGFASLLCFVALLFTSIPGSCQGYMWPKQDTYTTRWDKVNLDEILESKRLLQHYFKCLMSQGPCPPDGLELRRVLPEALKTGCAKCTKSQVEGAVKVIRYLREFAPTKFEMLASKYDSHGTYRRRYFEPPQNDLET